MSLEKLSDGNLVWFYREELEKIDGGARSTLLLPKNVRRRLIDKGILRYRKAREKTWGLILSQRGRKILDSYRHEEKGVP